MAAKPPAPSSDVITVGNPSAWQLLSKRSSVIEGWSVGTYAMQTENGCILLYSTAFKNPDGSIFTTEDVIFVPRVTIIPDINGGKKLV